MNNHAIRISVIFTTGFSLFACAPLFEDDSIWHQSPRPRAVEASLKSSIGYYESAVAAINGRHYALALDYLQAARAQRPDDVRVLTAFGVVYDKLGRFDLSARYYTQAFNLDPKSRVIAADLDYSRRLQGLSTGGPAPQVADSRPSPTEPLQPQTATASVEAPPRGLSVTATDIGQGLMSRAADPATSNASVKPKVAPAPAADIVAVADIGQGSTLPAVAPATSSASARPKAAAVSAPAAKVVATANLGQPSKPGTESPATSDASAKPKAAAVSAPAAKVVATANLGQRSTPRTESPATSDASAKPKVAAVSAPAAKVVATANLGQRSTPRTESPATSNASVKPKVAAAPAPAAKVVAVTNSGQAVTRRTVGPAISNVSAMAKMPAAPVSAAKTVVLTGHPLAIVDASGRGDTDKSVRSYLSGRGWSVAKDASAKRPAQAQTVILYKETMITAAKALARTLSLPMRLTVSNDILGLQLVLGGDISGTNIAKKHLAPQHRQIALAAANAGKRE